MLALRFAQDEYAFVFNQGRPIGAIVVGEMRGRQLSLLFAGRQSDFEILRPRAVERRFGFDELQRLTERFLADDAVAAEPLGTNLNTSR